VADAQRIDDLRRRVQKDPASLVFAQLGEECRRAGDLQEAIHVCRSGLAHHPEYLSARVTLGRALLANGQLEPAYLELSKVLRVAPDNLAALRGLAEIHERRGERTEAIEQYQKALALAPHDGDLAEVLTALAGAAAEPVALPQPPTPEAPSDGPPAPSTLTSSGQRPLVERQIACLEAWLASIHAARSGVSRN
jgi:tetratricopeptide (TPR) repeat protein